MIALLTGFYREPDEARRAELLECWRRNAALDHIDAMHLLIEDDTTPESAIELCPELAHPKVRLVPRGRRQTFQEFFNYAAAELPHRRVVLANADIYFDDSITAVKRCDLRRNMIVLARWDVQADGSSKLHDVDFSQDAWIFQPPVKLRNCDFTLGVAGCENRLAWAAHHIGRLKVENYARTIRAHHLHLSGLRRWPATGLRIGGPGRRVRPKAMRAG